MTDSGGPALRIERPLQPTHHRSSFPSAHSKRTDVVAATICRVCFMHRRCATKPGREREPERELDGGAKALKESGSTVHACDASEVEPPARTRAVQLSIVKLRTACATCIFARGHHGQSKARGAQSERGEGCSFDICAIKRSGQVLHGNAWLLLSKLCIISWGEEP